MRQNNDEAGNETEACPACLDGGACMPGGCGVDGCKWCGKPCPRCGGTCEVPKPKAAQPSADVVERVAMAMCDAMDAKVERNDRSWYWANDGLRESLRSDYRMFARAALSAIPQPAEVVGPAWRDKPDAEGYWQRLRDGTTDWFLLVRHEGELIPTGRGFTRPRPGDRWFGPVRIPEDKAGA
jgi:hypothetical protein